jgi:hypothetical protein
MWQRKNRFELVLLEAGKLQHICVKSRTLGRPENYEPAAKQRVFLRQQEDALAKLVDETEDDRSKLICLVDARSQSVRGRRALHF